ncbi:hypothetical protein [Stutzerimonas stutzeri]|uniref:hypothetical protein n=1 Tax=Stutzerimonas stutzeri TaxID=316 RepID=UPI00210CA07E|nr:hypothetical protein [Stutzerimonas stutzeri]MCQ4323218.1 hypothetical protein [Stutzerimonas stutzeri]
MTTWIIAYRKDGNTSILRTESNHQPDMDEAVALVTQKAEQDYAGQEDAYGHDPDAEETPATRLAERLLFIARLRIFRPAQACTPGEVGAIPQVRRTLYVIPVPNERG